MALDKINSNAAIATLSNLLSSLIVHLNSKGMINPAELNTIAQRTVAKSSDGVNDQAVRDFIKQMFPQADV